MKMINFLMFTPQEVSQYVLLTLKEFGISDVSVSWIVSDKVRGLAYAESARIELATNCLVSWKCFKETLLHEICHLLDYRQRGNSYMVNKRTVAHGKNWRKLCRAAGIPARLKIPD
jgi:predicted SprT family Zn-dependent metalloprotease